jgi:hypothetical protein
VFYVALSDAMPLLEMDDSAIEEPEMITRMGLLEGRPCLADMLSYPLSQHLTLGGCS